jgi:glucosamine--fructose-6-phosphate aminotransferase (isomerizing)
LTPKSRQEIVDLLIKGLQRLEYRGYDSAGLAIDTADGQNITIIKETGKVKALEDEILLRK